MKPTMRTEIGDPKKKNVCPCFDYSCVTMLPWTHHCLAFEILAIQLKHSPRWTNRQSHLNYPSRWTNPSGHCLRVIINSIQKYLRSVNSSYPSDGTHYIWPDRNHLIIKRISILKTIHPPISNRLIRQRLKNPKLGYIWLSLGLHLDCCRGISEWAFC